MFEPVPIPGQHDHGTHHQHHKQQRLERCAGCPEEADETGVPDRAVNNAEMDEIDEERLLSNRAEDVGQAVNAAAEVRGTLVAACMV